MEDKDIKEKINQVIEKSYDLNVYVKILEDFFTNEIETPSKTIMSLNILPKLNHKQIEQNIKKNIRNITSYIKNQIQSIKEAYQVLSCIYGSFLGDALGAFCEFQKPSSNNYKYILNTKNNVIGGIKGQVTDDSEMAMSLAYAIMDNPEKEKIDINYIFFYYGCWYKTSPLDIGHTTKNSLKLFNFNDFIPENKNFNKVEDQILTLNFSSLSNGFLMRKSTFIAWLYYRFYSEISEALTPIDSNEHLLNLYKKIRDLSKDDNKCTNPSFHADIVSSFYCIMALAAIKGYQSRNIIEKISNLCKDNYFKQKKDEESEIANYILNLIETFKDMKFDFNFFFGNKNSPHCVNNRTGFYQHAFELTLYYLIYFPQMEEEDKLKTMICEICNLGGDTDTNACIVGAVIGPLIGFSKFVDFDKIIDVIPPHRAIYSIALMYLFVKYLKQSNRDNKLIKNNRYFLKTILDLLYDEVDIEYS